MKAFLWNACLRDSCYNCSFKKKNRVSDVTLADYWGISNVHPKMNDNKGISLLIVNNDKGRELFELIRDNIKYVKTDLEKALKYNPAMVESVKCDSHREDFFNNLESMDFDNLVKRYSDNGSISQKILKKGIRIFKRIIK